MAPRHHQSWFQQARFSTIRAARAIRRSIDGVRDELGLKAMTIVQVDATTRLEKPGSEWCEQSGDSGLSSHRHSRWPDELHTCARPDGADAPDSRRQAQVAHAVQILTRGQVNVGRLCKAKSMDGGVEIFRVQPDGQNWRSIAHRSTGLGAQAGLVASPGLTAVISTPTQYFA